MKETFTALKKDSNKFSISYHPTDSGHDTSLYNNFEIIDTANNMFELKIKKSLN